jgi:hypothetical protein
MQEHNYEEKLHYFIEQYFKDINEISDFHIKFLVENNIQTIDLNLLLLKKFIFQAKNFLTNNVDISFSRFLAKLYLDIRSLSEFLENFEKKTQVIELIFENQFLPTLLEYKTLKSQIEKDKHYIKEVVFIISSIEAEMKFLNPQTKSDIKELKRLKKRLVDAIHYNAKAKENISKNTIALKDLKNELKGLFKEEFAKYYKSYVTKFKLILNTKLFYFNKKMWLEANQSPNIKKLNIKNINLTLYIENYLKHIEISKSQHFEEFLKIQDILKVLGQ